MSAYRIYKGLKCVSCVIYDAYIHIWNPLQTVWELSRQKCYFKTRKFPLVVHRTVLLLIYCNKIHKNQKITSTVFSTFNKFKLLSAKVGIKINYKRICFLYRYFIYDFIIKTFWYTFYTQSVSFLKDEIVLLCLLCGIYNRIISRIANVC